MSDRRNGSWRNGVSGWGMRCGRGLALVAVAWAMGGLAVARGAEREVTLAGLQVWNAGYWEAVSQGDYMGPNYKIRSLEPISMVGCRNGVHSGFIVATSSTAPIAGLKVRMSELTAKGGGKIPADRVRIRYPELARPDTSWNHPHRFDRLLDQPPDEVEMVDIGPRGNWKPRRGGPVAMQPIWVTVHVPSNAVPDDYAAELTVEADNDKPYVIPVRLRVHGWLLPDPGEYALRNMVWILPERPALRYDLPMWGEKHLAILGKTFEMALPLGSRHVEVLLVPRYPARDNQEVMVKWLKQPDGTFKYDFTVFDKYLDTVDKSIGKPFVIRLCMWSAERKPHHSVVVVDPATGQKSELEQPPYGTPESYAFWKPVLDELRARTDKRGWSDVVAPNWHEYCGGPDTNTVSVLKRIWPDAKWADTDHGRRTGFGGVTKEDWTPVLIQSTVWNEGSLKMRGYKGLKPTPPAYNGHARNRTWDWSPLWDLRVLVEEIIMKGNHGVDPIGGNLWMVQDERGRWSGGRWSAAAQGPQECTKAVMGPGPEGPVATERYEALREGVQICEAILFVQRSLDAGKVPPELAARANKILDARCARRMASWVLADKSGSMRFDLGQAAEGAFELEDELYAVAAAVSKAVGGNP